MFVFIRTHTAIRVSTGQILKEHSRVELVTVFGRDSEKGFVPSAVMAFSKGCPLLPVACECGIFYDKQVGTNGMKFCLSSFFRSEIRYNESSSPVRFIRYGFE